MTMSHTTAPVAAARSAEPAWSDCPPAACIEVAVHFKCNHQCVHCMIEGTMDWLVPESDDGLFRILEHNRRTRRWQAITLTGAEVTLRPDLPRLARAARDAGFQRVRIQTHGARLADAAYCRSLVEAGVNEFFISITAASAASHDAITGVPGSFERTLTGMRHLDACDGVAMLTNTVITARSYRELPAVVARMAEFQRLRQMEFWSYWPMERSDTRDLLVSHLDVLPYLRAALRAVRQSGRSAVVKNFPQCLLADDRGALDNGQPELQIDPAFWARFMQNGFHQCVHRARCRSQQCLGLNSAYVERFGWHAADLAPIA